jgi:hypothetical protein
MNSTFGNTNNSITDIIYTLNYIKNTIKISDAFTYLNKIEPNAIHIFSNSAPYFNFKTTTSLYKILIFNNSSNIFLISTSKVPINYTFYSINDGSKSVDKDGGNGGNILYQKDIPINFTECKQLINIKSNITPDKTYKLISAAPGGTGCANNNCANSGQDGIIFTGR